MVYYLLVFIAALILTVGLFLIKKSFFSFALATTSLLNLMLDTAMDEQVKHRLLIRTLGKFILKFIVLIIVVVAIITVSLIPIVLFIEYTGQTWSDIDSGSYKFYLSMIAGSAIPFLLTTRKKKKNYSDWSVLLHKMVMDNYNIAKSLFLLDKRIFKKKRANEPEPFVVVSGLARAGTTALTNLLFQSNKFHSLSYANMPFLLSVNLWKKFYHPGKSKLKQRAHGDKVKVGYNSVEAFEEFFFKVFLNDSFIAKNTLTEHDLNDSVFKEYMDYQNLIRPNNASTTYLAKNNNLILRHNSLVSNNAKYKVVLLFRHPIDHALSLKNQHYRFSKMQSKDSFVLEYMNWLGHHEFGLNHKAFGFDHLDLCNQFDTSSINYWISIWINYYTKLLSLENKDNMVIVNYEDLLNTPESLLAALSTELNLDLKVSNIEPFNKSSKPASHVDESVKNRALEVYEELQKMRLPIV